MALRRFKVNVEVFCSALLNSTGSALSVDASFNCFLQLPGLNWLKDGELNDLTYALYI